MSDLTPERRDEMRGLLHNHNAVPGYWCCDVLPQAAMDALPALLDAADECDRLAAAVERVRVLANGPYPHARNITGDDLTRALDGTEDPT